MSQSQFRIAFEGEKFDSGEIAINDFAPALLSLGDVIQSANKAINGDRADARLKLRATDQGSFTALLNLDISMVGAVIDMLDSVSEEAQRLTAANQLLELIIKVGKVGGMSVVGLIFALKVLKGRKPDSVNQNDKNTTAITIKDVTIIVDNRTVKLLEDLPTRQAVENFSNKALRIPGIERFKIGETDSRDELCLKSSDSEYFRVPEPADEDIKETIIEREAFLKIVTLSFQGDYKWRFTDGGEKPFTASIEDKEFLNRIDENQIALSKDDTLKCRLQEIQRLGPTALTKEIKVIQVLEYIPGARQLRLL